MPKEDNGKIGGVSKKGRGKPSSRPAKGPELLRGAAKKSAPVSKKADYIKKPEMPPVAFVGSPVGGAMVPVSAPVPKRATAPQKAQPTVSQPAKQRAVAPGLTRPSSVAEKNGAVLIFAGGIIAAALVIFFAVRYQTPRVAQVPSADKTSVQDQALSDVESKTDFTTWLAKWQTVDPYLNANEFTLESSGAIVLASPEIANAPDASALQPPLADRYVWSPDKTKFLDYLANFGEPDSSLVIYNRDGRGLNETLAFCGTPCRFTGAFWLDNDRAAVFGIADDMKADGTPLCIRNQGSVGDESQRCYRHLTLTVYDFANGTQQNYRSEKHSFPINPFEAEMHARWLSGLNEADRFTLTDSQEAIVMRGPVISIAADAGIIGVSDQNHLARLAAVSPSAVIRDAGDTPIGLKDIVVGSQVDVVAVKNDKGELTALSVRVLRGPVVTLSAPKEGSVVRSSFVVKGTAAASVDEVEIRITDPAVVSATYSVKVKPDATKGGVFTSTIDVAGHGFLKGDNMLIEIFIPANNPAAPAETALEVQYRP